MSVATIRHALAAVAAVFALVAVMLVPPVAPAEAATITYTDNSCAGFTVTGSGGTFQLVCAKLSCSIASSAGVNITPIGTTTTLTATCNPVANGYTWSANGNPANCPPLPAAVNGNQLSLAAPTVAVSGCVYQVDTTSATSGGGSATVSLSYSATAVSPPSGCSITRTPANGQLAVGGGGIAVNGNCTGTPATSWSWTKQGSAFGSTSNVQTDTLPANALTTAVTTTYVGTPSNGGAQGSPITVTFTTAGVVTGGGGGGAISCPGYGNTIVMNFNYVAGVQSRIYSTGTGFGDNDIIVAKFTTPATLANNGKGGFLNVVEIDTNTNTRTAILSATACDFTPNAQLTNRSIAYSPNIYFSNVATSGVVLQPNTTYYLNVTNKNGLGVGQCATGDCQVAVTLQGR